MNNIKIADLKDIDKLVEFHINNFENYYLTNLGRDLLKSYYAFFIKNNENKCYLYLHNDDRIIGLALFVSDFDIQINKFYKKHFYILIKNILKQVMLLNRVVIIGTFSRLSGVFIKHNKNYKLPKLTLLSLATSSLYRGKGIGKKLIINAEKNLSDLGLDSYYLSVLKDNLTAINFYHHLGFIEIYDEKEMIYLIKNIDKD